MDVIVQFWDDKRHEVSGRYLTSVFLGHATANDLLEKFEVSNLLQKFWDLLLWIFTAFQEATKEIDKKKIGHRWLENSCVIERALDILPHIRKYVAEVEKKPPITSFATVAKSLEDVCLESRLEFFKSVAVQLEPFLRLFQSRVPLAPLLYEHLTSILQALLERIVTSATMKSIKTTKQLLAFDLSSPASSAFLPVAEIDIGKRFWVFQTLSVGYIVEKRVEQASYSTPFPATKFFFQASVQNESSRNKVLIASAKYSMPTAEHSWLQRSRNSLKGHLSNLR